MRFILIGMLLASVSAVANNSLFTGLKYPSVANAIFQLETGHGTSRLYTKHNNLFGMKTSKRGIHIGKTKKGYAIYDCRYASVLDYSYYERNLIRKYNIKTKKQYIYRLSRTYAENSEYRKLLIKQLWSNS